MHFFLNPWWSLEELRRVYNKVSLKDISWTVVIIVGNKLNPYSHILDIYLDAEDGLVIRSFSHFPTIRLIRMWTGPLTSVTSFLRLTMRNQWPRRGKSSSSAHRSSKATLHLQDSWRLKYFTSFPCGGAGHTQWGGGPRTHHQTGSHSKNNQTSTIKFYWTSERNKNIPLGLRTFEYSHLLLSNKSTTTCWHLETCSASLERTDETDDRPKDWSSSTSADRHQFNDPHTTNLSKLLRLILNKD